MTTMDSTGTSAIGRLFVLDLSGGRILSLKPDGSDRRVVITECRHPDGVAIDAEAGHVYWTNMGVPHLDDGSIERADLDGLYRTVIVPEGSTFTPKQLQLDRKNRRLYWSDREGMRVMRSNLDGSNVETLVERGCGDADRTDVLRRCVGIALDVERGQFYWTQKGPGKGGKGRIFRASAEMPGGQTPSNRSDIELLYDGLPEPIDLQLDLRNRMMYWTDRGDPPRGNTVNRAPMDNGPTGRKAPEILVTHLMEGIGLALDLTEGRMFFTDLGGSIYTARLDGSDKKTLLEMQGNLTGIAYVELTTQG